MAALSRQLALDHGLTGRVPVLVGISLATSPPWELRFMTLESRPWTWLKPRQAHMKAALTGAALFKSARLPWTFPGLRFARFTLPSHPLMPLHAIACPRTDTCSLASPGVYRSNSH